MKCSERGSIQLLGQNSDPQLTSKVGLYEAPSSSETYIRWEKKGLGDDHCDPYWNVCIAYCSCYSSGNWISSASVAEVWFGATLAQPHNVHNTVSALEKDLTVPDTHSG